MRVRFAPSPTGYLHIGGLRTALYNFLEARRNAGSFILRIEDTDRTRFVEDAEQDILDSLRWAGIDFDEGPGVDGGFGPYRQSERSELYRRAADALLQSGDAYIAFDTPEEIEAMREEIRSDSNPNPTYDASTREKMTNSLTLEAGEVQRRIEGGAPHVIRLNVRPGRQVGFEDVVRGEVTFSTDSVDDQILIKSDGMPTYHLANVVDDHHMGITHVIRGEEWLPSTPKHILLYHAMGWSPPKMAHLPLILSPTGGKLSKRNAEKQGIDVSVADYRKAGYEAAALINYLAFLGWNPGTDQEVFTLDDLVDVFSLERVGQAGVQFDKDKLAWFNEQHLRSRSAEDLAEELRPHVVQRYGDIASEDLVTMIPLMIERMSFAHDFLEAGYLFRDPGSYDEAGVSKRWKEDSPVLVGAYADRLEDLSDWTAENLESEMRSLAEEQEAGFGRIMAPVRLAVTGVMAGPSMWDLMVVLGKETTVRRLRKAAETIVG